MFRVFGMFHKLSLVTSSKSCQKTYGPPHTALVHSFHQLGIASFGGIAGLLAEAATIRESRSMSQPKQLRIGRSFDQSKHTERIRKKFKNPQPMKSCLGSPECLNKAYQVRFNPGRKQKILFTFHVSQTHGAWWS